MARRRHKWRAQVDRSGSTWSAGPVRRTAAGGTLRSKWQSGFESKPEACAYAKAVLAARETRRRKKRAPMPERLAAGLEKRRLVGWSPARIAQYVANFCSQFALNADAAPLRLPERVALGQLQQALAERRAAKLQAAAERATQDPAPLPPPSPNLGRRGVSPTGACEALNCSLTELNRWAGDGRLMPDGQKFYCGVGPLGGSRWGRAWLPETIETAKLCIAEWRIQDATRKTAKRLGLRVVDGRRKRPPKRMPNARPI
jgi:hypothetical protein